jgi:hypothetical protein
LSSSARCRPNPSCFDPGLKAGHHYDEGLTGLALLCFLDAGFGPASDASLVDPLYDTRYRTAEVVERGLDWLRARQHADGSFTEDNAFLYNEALATAAMVEAYGLTRDDRWKEPAQRAVNFLQAAQRPAPDGSGLWGWRYVGRSEIEEHARVFPGEMEDISRSDLEAFFRKELHDSDTSVTSWCVLAIARAKRHGLDVTQSSMDGAMAFCQFVTSENGLVGYLDAKGAGAKVTGPFDDRFAYHVATMSALGMIIRMYATRNSDDPFLDLAAKRVAMDLPTVSGDRASIDYYYWHAASLALFQFDGPGSPRRSGKYWSVWNNALLGAVLPLQDHTEGACTNGGWVVSDRWGSYSGAGPLYNTALNVLTLEVYYRYDNVFALPRGVPTDVGDPAPDFEGSEAAGSKFSLSGFRGTIVLIDFWNPGDEHFDPSLAERARLAKRMKGRPFVILGVGIDRQADPRYPAAAAAHAAGWKWTREDWADSPIHREYSITRSTTLVVDASGTIRSRGDAWVSWEETVALVDRLVDELEGKARPK